MNLGVIYVLKGIVYYIIYWVLVIFEYYANNI